MRILLVPNLDKSAGKDCTLRVIRKLLDLGAQPLLDIRFRECLEDSECRYGAFCDLLEECDLLIAIGGDGTILHCAKHAIHANKPLMGINVGRIGFLAQLEQNELDQLEKLLAGKYAIRSRMLLKVTIISVLPDRHASYLALNEVVFSKGGRPGLVDLQVSRDGRLIADYRADGLIISTPTGSTAYSLSAGGPIAEPDVDVFLMTAICPHSPFNRSIVLPAGERYQVRVPAEFSQDIRMTLDGEKTVRLYHDDYVAVEKAETGAQFLELGERDFYKTLNSKVMYRG